MKCSNVRTNRNIFYFLKFLSWDYGHYYKASENVKVREATLEPSTFSVATVASMETSRVYVRVSGERKLSQQ